MGEEHYVAFFQQFLGSNHFLYGCAMIIWVSLLFYMLYAIAEHHFSPALQYLSRSFRLSPDLAGITLLAIGNGAPDFFTSMFGAEKAPKLILGSSVGSGLFTVTFVFGAVIIFSNLEGKAPSTKSGLPLQRSHYLPELLHESAYSVQSPPLKSNRWKDRLGKISFSSFLRSTLLYLFCALVLVIFCILPIIPFWLPLGLLVVFGVYIVSVVSLFFYHASKEQSSPSMSIEEKAPGSVIDEDCVKSAWSNFWNMSLGYKMIFLVKEAYWQDSWLDSLTKSFISMPLHFIVAPLDVLLSLTILPLDPPADLAISSASFVAISVWHRLRCLLNPIASLTLLSVLYFDSAFESLSVWIKFSFVFLVIALTVLMAWTTAWEHTPRGHFFHIAYAFLMCIVWIYVTSGEVVNCLCATGRIMGLSDTIMGIVVLAWGNSFGDLVADVAIAKSGGYETAIVAVFSGPVQNVLLTIGAAFLSVALKNGNASSSSSWSIAMDAMGLEMYVALGFLIFSILLSAIAVPLLFKMRIPKYFGYILIAIYLCYLPIALSFALYIF